MSASGRAYNLTRTHSAQIDDPELGAFEGTYTAGEYFGPPDDLQLIHMDGMFGSGTGLQLHQRA